MHSIGWTVALLAIGLSAAAAATAIPPLAQGDACPAEFPVDCGNSCCVAGSFCASEGACCPRGTWDSGEGYCIPAGHPYCGEGRYCDPGDAVTCRGGCYRAAADAEADGCPASEQAACTAPPR